MIEEEKYYMTKIVLQFNKFDIPIGSKIKLVEILLMSGDSGYLFEYNNNQYTISRNEMNKNCYGLLEHRKNVISKYYNTKK